MRSIDEYRAWVRGKTNRVEVNGFDVDEGDLNPRMRADQKAITAWALRRGRAAEFITTGGGKALSALENGADINTEGTRVPYLGGKYAGPKITRAPEWVWLDVDRMDTLNYQLAKDGKDEKHICPLQLDLIERSVRLWTNAGDVVLDPFAGIGSVPYKAVEMGRNGVGFELKDSYYRWACKYLEDAERAAKVSTLFELP